MFYVLNYYFYDIIKFGSGSERRRWTLAALSCDGEQRRQLHAMDAAVRGDSAIIC